MLRNRLSSTLSKDSAGTRVKYRRPLSEVWTQTMLEFIWQKDVAEVALFVSLNTKQRV